MGEKAASRETWNGITAGAVQQYTNKPNSNLKGVARKSARTVDFAQKDVGPPGIEPRVAGEDVPPPLRSRLLQHHSLQVPVSAGQQTPQLHLATRHTV